MKYLLLAGEVSGDKHGADLMKALRNQDSDASFIYLGGSLMDQYGDIKIEDISALSVMGFKEVLLKLPSIWRLMSTVKKAILLHQPDIIIFIDNPGFNLRVAKWANKRGYKTCYYILPKAWAWNTKRTKKIKNSIDLPLSILPFEVPFYEKYGVHCQYVGNPSFDQINRWKLDVNRKATDTKRPRIVLLPGSRLQEVTRMLPILLESVDKLSKEYEIVVSQSSNLDISLYDSVKTKGYKLESDFYSLLSSADIAVVTSGTATLETAFFNVPQLVAYKTSNFSYQIAIRVIKVEFISLVNLIAEKMLVKEMIQSSCSPFNLEQELKRLSNLTNEQRAQFYSSLNSVIGEKVASKEAAKAILGCIENS